jgi:hypothetical protein
MGMKDRGFSCIYKKLLIKIEPILIGLLYSIKNKMETSVASVATVATVASGEAVASKITRELFAKPLIDIINLDVFDNDAIRGEPSPKEYQVPVHQRFPHWKKPQCQLLVDSVMRDLPMSSILMTRDIVSYKGESCFVNYIQDGQTRLSILQDFMKNKFNWNNRYYKDFAEVERSRFNNYSVKVELIKRKPLVSQQEFKNICRLIFSRINSGKPLTDNDKFHNCMDEPVLQFIMNLKQEPEFRAPLKKIFGDIGGGKTRTALANMVGIVLAIALDKSDTIDPGDCISPSYIDNSQYVINEEGTTTAIAITALVKGKVRDFFRWYIELTEDIKKQPMAKKITKGLFAKISGLLALTLQDWIDGVAKDRRAVWIEFALKLNDDKMYEKRVCSSLPIGILSNNSAENFRKRIQCICLAYEKRSVAPTSGSEESSDEEDEYESGED